MTDTIPDWFKVKLAAVTGVGTPFAAGLLNTLGEALDLLIKLGQIGVAVVTILYIISKWNKVRGPKGRRGVKGEAGERGPKGQ